ncbi:hypothetical protein ACL9RI_21700 [Janthinobacterium sp. Mn2066]|uniref:hypothetical protein n=1 Tax=Janthinobacterium sp. Mn2066 TaxID=3395264 RepID=UPI003BEE8D0E
MILKERLEFPAFLDTSRLFVFLRMRLHARRHIRLIAIQLVDSFFHAWHGGFKFIAGFGTEHLIDIGTQDAAAEIFHARIVPCWARNSGCSLPCGANCSAPLMAINGHHHADILPIVDR